MNLKKLREAEGVFLHRYPDGFDDEEMKGVKKRHNVDKLIDFAKTAFAKKNFANQGAVLDDVVKVVSRSSMVSMFEKPKFRDFVNGMPNVLPPPKRHLRETHHNKKCHSAVRADASRIQAQTQLGLLQRLSRSNHRDEGSGASEPVAQQRSVHRFPDDDERC